MSTSAIFPVRKAYSMPAQLVSEFKFNSIETNIIDILKGACTYSKQNTVMRIAGGWVRDKLLGHDSMDIDIALDNISGIHFAEIVNEYMKSKNLETHTIGKIEANPEQSKHLETARVRILNEWVDLVNLRSENYVQNSRIPTITYGTPKEDAFRRDLTINALFYNINENKIEDFTEKGVDDLLHGIIRTPLEPLATLTDDPLRALRAIRFASRYYYRINDELYIALSSQFVHEALCQKVSNERIGKEFCEILLGPNAQYGIELLYFTGLLNIIIRPIPNITTSVTPSIPSLIASDEDLIYKKNELLNKGFLLTEICEWLIQNNLIKISTIPNSSIDESTTISIGSSKSMLYFICLLMPVYLENHVDDKQLPKFVKSVVIHTLKCKNSDSKICENILFSINLFQQAIVDHKPVTIGKAIKLAQEYWEVGLELTFIYNLFLHYVTFDNNYQIICDGEKIQEAINQFNNFHQLIYDLKLDSFYNVKALLNGKDIMNLGVPKGPEVKKVLDLILEWQMENPSGTKEDCEIYVKTNIINKLSF